MNKMKSENFDERAGGVSPSMIVLHYTGMESGAQALARLCDPDSKVSAHYFIDEEGGIVQLVDNEKRAWHAGVSYWDGEKDINSHSIGIELVNPGHEFGYKEFPATQIKALTGLCADLIKQYNITADRVLGHSDVAPARKKDPGEYFPWAALSEKGIGLWPHLGEADLAAATDVLSSEGSFHALLVRFGYNPEESPECVTEAFHRHFYPEKFLENNDPRIPDATSTARLLALLRACESA